MMDIFRIASTAPQDKSIEYLRQIFGSMNGVLSDPLNPSNDTTINLVSQMFKTFNTVMLAVGALIVVYVIIVGAMKTAHEGEAMGKQWNSIWIPIRIVLGIASLFPTGAGYCVIQIVMMWVIVQGIGAADSLWNTVVTYVQRLGSVYAQVTVPTTGVQNTFRDLFKGIACDATMRRTDATPVISANPLDIKGTYFCRAPGMLGQSFCDSNPAFDKSADTDTYSMGPSGVCGKLTYCKKSVACPNNMNPASNEASLACKTCAAQLDQLEATITQQRQIAQLLVQADYDYRGFYAFNPPKKAAWIGDYCSQNKITGCCISSSSSPDNCVKFDDPSADQTFPKPDAAGANGWQNASTEAVQGLFWPYAVKPSVDVNFLKVETDNYVKSLTDITKKFVDDKASQSTTTLDPMLADAAKTGWLYAGAFYYVIGKTNGDNQSTALPSMSVNLPSNFDSYSVNRINNRAAKDLIVAMLSDAGITSTGEGGATATASQTQGSSLTNDKNMGDIFTLISELKSDLGNVFSGTSPSSNTNPIFTAQAMGFLLLIILEIFFAAFLIAAVILGLVGNINIFVLGNSIMDPIGPMATLVFIVLVPALYGLMGIMAVYGGLLGVYVPLIPFMVFTASAITWFLMVLETMVAGPLVAIGVMMPGGHHEVMGRAEPALMMLLNIFLRPSLMIFGLMVGMLLSTVLCNLIFYTFWSIFIPKAGQPGVAFLAWVFYMGAFVALVVAAVNKSYTAIYLLPERVITWIGGHAAQGGEAEMAGEAKHAIEGGARGMGTAAQTAGGAPKGVQEALGQQAKAVGEKHKAAGGTESAAQASASTPAPSGGAGGGSGTAPGGSGGGTTPGGGSGTGGGKVK